MSTLPQTTGSGVPTALQQKYPALGRTGQFSQGPASSIRAFIVGPPKGGKSSILQTCPDCFLMNLDCSPSVSPGHGIPLATIWPWLDEAGQVADERGRITPTYDDVLRKIDILFQLAKNNQPRPKLVCFDSVTSWIEMIKAWMPANAGKLNLADGPRTDWKQLMGEAAWDMLYTFITGTILKLHSSGYGVYLVGHVVNRNIPIGDGAISPTPELTITPKFWNRLFPHFDLICRVDSHTVIEQVNVTVPFPKKVSKPVRRSRMVFRDPKMAGVLECRLSTLPDELILSNDDAWQTFETCYNNAVFDRVVS
jgi:hypothetical protein